MPLSDCSASFASLNVSLYSFSSTGSLIVQPPGPGQSVLRVTEGRELQLTCIYRGSGAEGELTWAGPAVRQGRARITRSGPNRSRLEFSPLSSSDNGTYVCLFANEAATIEIIVHSEYVSVYVWLSNPVYTTAERPIGRLGDARFISRLVPITLFGWIRDRGIEARILGLS